jgi:hypothetical protein
VSAFEAPVEFKSKKEFRHMKESREMERRAFSAGAGGEDRMKFNMKFQTKSGEIHRFRHAANVVKNVINFEGGSIHKDDWLEECKAGVKYWVNKQTGEVATTCPWKDPVENAVKKFLNHKLIKNNQRLITDEEVGAGTGSLVYDSSEVNELFELLDKGGKRK